MPSQQPQILLVDDNPVVLMTTELVFKRAGYDVRTAASGEEAIVALGERTYQVMLIDLHLPGMSGAALAQIARQDQPAAAVAILTGSGATEDELSDPALSAFPVLRKTVGPAEILALVADMLPEDMVVGKR